MRGIRLYHRELMTWAHFDMGCGEMAVVGCLIEEYFIILLLDASLSEHLSKPCLYTRLHNSFRYQYHSEPNRVDSIANAAPADQTGYHSIRQDCTSLP